MNYLVAVLSDRIQAEEAYSALERAGLPLAQVAILGRGYQSADEYGLIDPKEEAWKQVRRMAYWVIPFGFGAGATFSVITGLNTFAWAGEVGNHIVGGLLGAVAGAMGRVKANAAPPSGRLRALMRPPCASTSPFATASPRPVPPDSRLRAGSTR